MAINRYLEDNKMLQEFRRSFTQFALNTALFPCYRDNKKFFNKRKLAMFVLVAKKGEFSSKQTLI